MLIQISNDETPSIVPKVSVSCVCVLDSSGGQTPPPAAGKEIRQTVKTYFSIFTPVERSHNFQ